MCKIEVGPRHFRGTPNWWPTYCITHLVHFSSDGTVSECSYGKDAPIKLAPICFEHCRGDCRQRYTKQGGRTCPERK